MIVRAIDQLPVNPGLRDAAEALLIDEARTRDASELEALGKHVLERLDPDGTERRDERAAEREERSAHAGRHLSLVEDGLGAVRIRGRGTVEDTAWIKSSLFALAAPNPPAECGAEATDRGGACGTTDCAHDGATRATTEPACGTPSWRCAACSAAPTCCPTATAPLPTSS